jgi:hypothetical protein
MTANKQADKHRLLRANGQRQRDEFLCKIEDAKALIKQRCSENGGAYPDNAGKLSIKEFCRIAAVSEDALHHANHRHTTKPAVRAFIAGLTSSVDLRPKPRPKAKRDIWKERYDDLWTRYLGLARNYNLAEICLIKERERVRELGGTPATESAEDGNRGCTAQLPREVKK